MSGWFQDASQGDDESKFATLQVRNYGLQYDGSGRLIDRGDPPARVRPVKAKPQVPPEHVEKAMEFLSARTSELEAILPMLEVCRNIQAPAMSPGEQVKNLVRRLKEAQGILAVNPSSFGQPYDMDLRNYPDISTVIRYILETGEVPVSSISECKKFAEERDREAADRAFKINLERNIASKKARDEEKAKKETLEKKRAEFEKEYGLSLGPLPRGSG